MVPRYVVGVDVGTGSVRAALVTIDGELIKMAVHPIQTWNFKPGFYHQSSDDIWNSCCKVIREVVAEVPADSIKGVGFDATCSLVALDKNGSPISISPGGETQQNVILWMDHRAEKEAEAVNATKHPVLQSVGGKISLEMQVPKLMWLKKNLPETWKNVGAFYDLPDFLTWKSTGAESRSLCSVVCKWTYEASGEGLQGWNKQFFTQVGLSDLLADDCRKIGNIVLPPGTPCGSGLNIQATKQLGLRVGTPVATSIIDAHAGGLGMIGCTADLNKSTDYCSRLGLICGTSTCHMAVSRGPVFVPGVWGPYYSAMVPGLWLSEGGQSATGRLLDHIIDTHPATATLRARSPQMHVVSYLNELLDSLANAAGLDSVDLLTKDLHVWPDHHGNRSPLADPTLRGMVSGLSLSCDEKDLALLYLATVQALAYGTRHIIESLESAGHRRMDCVLLCGGLSKNPLFIQTQATVVGRPVLVPQRTEAVLGGAAILAAYAAGLYPSLEAAVNAMAGQADAVSPNIKAIIFHNKKYEVFLRMVQHQKEYRDIMNSV
uniref:FGGY carbohydrate kinase domain-containing protein n=2 Tax=Cuerna arida TaxID=1464854 RepID=A0A1B6GW67_9HEMI